VTASFSRAAAKYRGYARVQKAMADWLSDWVPEDRSGRAIEVGAGPGVFTDRLLPWTGMFVATDSSSAMCEVGRQALPGLDWRTMSAERLDGGPWDWIFSSSMLQWLREPAEVFAHWRGQLADRGRVVGGLFAAGSLEELHPLIGDLTPIAWRSASEWARAARQGGLRIVREDTERRVFWHDSANDFLRSLHGVGAAPTRHLSTGALRRLLREYEAKFGGEKGVRASWMFYRFEAVRACSGEGSILGSVREIETRR
jgi:SAM-dependent methyltransferase